MKKKKEEEFTCIYIFNSPATHLVTLAHGFSSSLVLFSDLFYELSAAGFDSSQNALCWVQASAIKEVQTLSFFFLLYIETLTTLLIHKQYLLLFAVFLLFISAVCIIIS